MWHWSTVGWWGRTVGQGRGLLFVNRNSLVVPLHPKSIAQLASYREAIFCRVDLIWALRDFGLRISILLSYVSSSCMKSGVGRRYSRKMLYFSVAVISSWLTCKGSERIYLAETASTLSSMTCGLSLKWIYLNLVSFLVSLHFDILDKRNESETIYQMGGR